VSVVGRAMPKPTTMTVVPPLLRSASARDSVTDRREAQQSPCRASLTLLVASAAGALGKGGWGHRAVELTAGACGGSLSNRRCFSGDASTTHFCGI
jgi:hypothetical protein